MNRERWIRPFGEDGKYGCTPKADAFLREIVQVCEKHGMWLGHEDGHGAFKIVQNSTAEWLSRAYDVRPGKLLKGGR